MAVKKQGRSSGGGGLFLNGRVQDNIIIKVMFVQVTEGNVHLPSSILYPPPSIHQSSRLAVYLSIQLSVCPFVHPPTHPSTHPSIIHPSSHPPISVRPSVHPSTHPPTHASIPLSSHPLPIHRLLLGTQTHRRE